MSLVVDEDASFQMLNLHSVTMNPLHWVSRGGWGGVRLLIPPSGLLGGVTKTRAEGRNFIHTLY